MFNRYLLKLFFKKWSICNYICLSAGKHIADDFVGYLECVLQLKYSKECPSRGCTHTKTLYLLCQVYACNGEQSASRTQMNRAAEMEEDSCSTSFSICLPLYFMSSDTNLHSQTCDVFAGTDTDSRAVWVYAEGSDTHSHFILLM